ncbi:MAG: L,D-transpeptidase family protein [Paracoccaceae bacterium]
MTISRRAALAALIAFYAIPNSTLAQSTVANTPAVQADLIMLYKSSRKLVLFNNRKPLGIYMVDLGSSPDGDKGRFGDGRTPEGTYFIDRRNANSAYHLSLGISYPNAEDRAEAAALGLNPGGDIFIHGGPTRFWDHFKQDWTAGCISVNNREIEEIWAMVPLGTPIVIVP